MVRRWVQVEPALVDTLIENRQAIEVNAGQILLSSRAVNELARGVIRQSGTLTANSMVQSGGRILLESDDIRLSSSAQIQANGAVGGGDVLIGGIGRVVRTLSAACSRIQTHCIKPIPSEWSRRKHSGQCHR